MGNREALLEAAATCIVDRGYARTTARDLVEASGTNLGAIGYHFGSKEHLLNEAIYRGFSEWLAEVAAAVPPTAAGDVWEVVEAALERTLASFESHRPLCVAFLEALTQAERSAELREQIAAGYDRYRSAIAGHLRALTGDGALPEADAANLAAVIVALSDGLLIQWLLDPARVPSAAALTGSLQAVATRRSPAAKGRPA